MNINTYIDKLFLIILAIFLVIPLSHINHDEKSITENRMLAAYPALVTKDNAINTKYGIEYDKWFSDRFFGRDILIKLYGLKSGCEDGLKVLVEKDNWLFYKDENSLRNFANLDILSPEQLQQTAKYLQDINDWCKKHNKKFLFVIAPDKNKIYGEHITKVMKVHPDSESRAVRLVEYLRNNTDVNVLYPYEQLVANKPRGFLYMKNDTHWNDFGAYIGYTEIMKALKLKPITYKTATQKTNPRGDLTGMAPNIPLDNETIYISPDIRNTATCDNEFPSTNDITCTNPNYKINKTMLTFRDSFAIALGRYYANTFKTIKYRNGNTVTKDDLKYIKDNVDIVISEIVERNVASLSSQQFPKD